MKSHSYHLRIFELHALHGAQAVVVAVEARLFVSGFGHHPPPRHRGRSMEDTPTRVYEHIKQKGDMYDVYIYYILYIYIYIYYIYIYIVYILYIIYIYLIIQIKNR